MSKLMMLVAAKWREFKATQPAEEPVAGSPAEPEPDSDGDGEPAAEELEDELDEPEVVRPSARSSRGSKKKPAPVSL